MAKSETDLILLNKILGDKKSEKEQHAKTKAFGTSDVKEVPLRLLSYRS